MTNQVLKNRQILADVRETIDDVHRNIYLGKTFTTFWANEDGDTIADNALFGIVLRTNSLQAQLNMAVAGGGDTEAIMYESPTLSVTGTPLEIYSLLRNASDVSSCQAWHSPTITTGTVLARYFLPGGWTNNTPGGMYRENTHWILNTGTIYALVGVNRAGSAQFGSINLQWYEEER